MSLLRIFCTLRDLPQRCQWALVNAGVEPVTGEGPLAQLPLQLRRGAEHIQLVIPAAQVLITRAQLPHSARRRAGSLLAYAVEENTASEPDVNQVSWLGAVMGNDVLAVVDKPALTRWRDALDAVGIQDYEVHCETLLLPWVKGEWSLFWNGIDGFVRIGEFEGAATDCGSREAPPLSMRMMLEAAELGSAGPTSIVLYTSAADAIPDIEAWREALGVAVRFAGNWDWRTLPFGAGAGVSLAQEQQRWRAFTGVAARLRPAAWIFGAALAIQGIALVIDWMSLASEQRNLRQQMESRFRSVFPDAVAVADPALQMRRKLAEARHAAGRPDSGDFLPLAEQVAAAIMGFPAGAVRTVAYEGGRMTLELSAVDEAGVRQIAARLRQAGLGVDSGIGIPSAAPRTASAKVILTIRAL